MKIATMLLILSIATLARADCWQSCDDAYAKCTAACMDSKNRFACAKACGDQEQRCKQRCK